MSNKYELQKRYMSTYTIPSQGVYVVGSLL